MTSQAEFCIGDDDFIADIVHNTEDVDQWTARDTDDIKVTHWLSKYFAAKARTMEYHQEMLEICEHLKVWKRNRDMARATKKREHQQHIEKVERKNKETGKAKLAQKKSRAEQKRDVKAVIGQKKEIKKRIKKADPKIVKDLEKFVKIGEGAEFEVMKQE